MILGMFSTVDLNVRLLQPRATVCWLLLLAYLAVFAHEIAADHAEVDTTCAVCVVADRLNDAAMTSGGGPQSGVLLLPARYLRTASVATAESPVSASRDPPVSG